MDASSFRPESHIAQQSRRYKLRIQQNSPQSLREFAGNSEHLAVHPAATGLLQVRNVGNDTMLSDPTVFSSEMISFSTGSNVSSSPPRDGMAHRLIRGHEDSSFTNVSNYPVLCDTTLDVSARAGTGEQQSCGGNWNYSGGSVGGEGNQKPMFVGEVLSNNARVSCLSTSTIPIHLKPNYDGYHDVQLQSNLSNPISELSSQDGQKQLREIKFTYHPIYNSAFQDAATRAEVRGNDCGLIPSGNSQSIYQSTSQIGNGNDFVSRLVENCHQWGDELRHVARKSDQELRTMGIDASTHGLSLSLSSNPPSQMNAMQFGEQLYDSEYLQVKDSVTKEPDQDSKFEKSSYSGAMPRPAIISKSCGQSLHDMVALSTYVLRNTGPLGPFTGYATILKSSRFLKPAQELLDEFCRLTGSTVRRASETSERLSIDFSTSASAGGNAVIAEAEAKGNSNSAISSSTLHSSNDGSGDGGVGRSSRESIWPDYQQEKAKLLYLQEEVCRKYKQYHQQMQIVSSSFELVAGLSDATPYVSLALKAVSRSFRCLKHAISERLKQIAKVLGEDFLSPNGGASSSKGDTGTSNQRYMDQSFQKHKPGGASVGFLEPQQHVWRPQRGLPERAVAILRAWLFEHFLHPYPTDTDKHMLATQTGLSRNQVSNWFINARVRVWKPMVEEIHMLETKGLAESNQNSVKNNVNSSEGSRQPHGEQPSNKLGTFNSMISKQLECSGVGFSVSCGEQLGTEQWNQEKKSRVEFHNPTNVDGSSMDFLPYHRSEIDIGGVGNVSLTLGLRHGVDNAQHRQQLQQHEEQLIRHQFEGQMIHDFTG